MNLGVCLNYAVTLRNGAEGFVARAFLDPRASPPIWTIGHGSTRVGAGPVRDGMVCTKHQADLWAMAEMLEAAHFVLRCLRVPLNEWQFGAMVSFCHNIGTADFERSSVLEAINLGLLRVAADRLLEYDEPGLGGLKTRRARERAVFMMGLGLYVTPYVKGIAPPDAYAGALALRNASRTIPVTELIPEGAGAAYDVC